MTRVSIPVLIVAAALGAARAWAATTITEMYSTSYKYTSSPDAGYDPSIITKKAVSINFVDGDFPAASINATGGQPLVVGVRVEENRLGQTMIGNGCGVSDSAAIVLQDLKASHPDSYAEIMKLLYSQDAKDLDDGVGAGLVHLRSPLGSSDFAVNEYTYDDTADCSPDEEFSNFNINKAPKVYATHKDALAINAGVNSWWLPWSGPAWMKTNCTLRGSELAPKYETLYAEYLARSVDEIGKRIGKKPYRVSLQENPLNQPKKYPGQKITPEAAARVGEALRTKLDGRGLQETGIGAGELSWDNPDYLIDTFDTAKLNTFASASFHCYGGDEKNIEEFSSKFPNVPVDMTECTRVTQNMDEFWKNLRKNALSLAMRSIDYGSRSVILWNCVLAADGDGMTTPALPDNCQNCLAPVLVAKSAVTAGASADASTSTDKAPQRRSRLPARFAARDLAARQLPTSSSVFKLTSDFAILAHLSRAIRLPGSGSGSGSGSDGGDGAFARRVGTVTTDDPTTFHYEDGARVFSQGFVHNLPNGKKRYALVILQKNDHYLSGKYDPATVVIGFRNQIAKLENLEVGLYTVVWEA